MVFFIGTLGSCGWKPQAGSPWKQDLLKNAPPGSSEKFKLGWQHGCETGISAAANTFLKQFYKFRQDGFLVSEQEYYTGWKTAYSYCMRYYFQYVDTELVRGGSGIESLFGGQ